MSTKTKFPEIADIQLYREQVIKEINDTEHKTQYIEKNAESYLRIRIDNVFKCLFIKFGYL